MATVIVQREDARTFRKKKVHIVLDGKRVATIGNGETVEFTVTNGAHKLNVALDFFAGNKLRLDAMYGDTYYYDISPSKTHWLSVPVVICVILIGGIPERIIPLKVNIAIMLALAVPLFIWKMILKDAYFNLKETTVEQPAT